MPTLLELLKQKREEEAKKKSTIFTPKTTPKIVPRKRKKQPKPTKKPVKPIVIIKEKIGTEYTYTSNDPELIKWKMKIDKLKQRPNEHQQTFFKRRIRMRLILEEMINKKLGKPVNLEKQYRIETDRRPLYSGKRPTYAFMDWLSNKKLTTKQRRKYSEHSGLFKDIEESKEPEEEVEETKEETVEEEEPKKTEASNQGTTNMQEINPAVSQEIVLLKFEMNKLKKMFRQIRTNGTSEPIVRNKQRRPEQKISGNEMNFGRVIAEMKEMFARVENACDLLSPTNGRNSIEAPPVILA